MHRNGQNEISSPQPGARIARQVGIRYRPLPATVGWRPKLTSYDQHPSSQTHLRAQALTCERGDRLLFEDVSFEAKANSAIQIAGPNGSGKTTMLRIICGLVQALSGDLLWRGRSIEEDRTAFHRELCYLGYAGGVKLELTPRENLAFAAALQVGRQSNDAIEHALERVDLYGFEDVAAYTLSAGQRRRISLARLLLTGAPLWILDEPLTALDRDGTTLAESLMREHVSGGGILVFTTHQPLDEPPPSTTTVMLG